MGKGVGVQFIALSVEAVAVGVERRERKIKLFWIKNYPSTPPGTGVDFGLACARARVRVRACAPGPACACVRVPARVTRPRAFYLTARPSNKP